MRESLGEVYDMAPPVNLLDRWAGGLIGYRSLLSSPMARISIRSSERLVRNRPWVAEVELATVYERGLELAESYLEAGGLAVDSEERLLAESIGDGPLV